MTDDELIAMLKDADALENDCDCNGRYAASHIRVLVEEVRRLRAAASAVIFWRHKSGEFVDGFMAQQKLNDLAALFPAGYKHWPNDAEGKANG